ncbi:hypothetical protein D3C78_1338300 [compost metagenome]
MLLHDNIVIFKIDIYRRFLGFIISQVNALPAYNIARSLKRHFNIAKIAASVQIHFTGSSWRRCEQDRILFKLGHTAKHIPFPGFTFIPAYKLHRFPGVLSYFHKQVIGGPIRSRLDSGQIIDIIILVV